MDLNKRARTDIDSPIPNAGVFNTGIDIGNLAIKGIIAIGAMSKMSSVIGQIADANHYSVCTNPSDFKR